MKKTYLTVVVGIVVMDVVKRVEEGQAFTRYKFTKYCIKY